MPDSSFPTIPAPPASPPAPVALVVRGADLTAIREVLSLSIHDVVNEARHKRIVLDFYRLTRRIGDEVWIRHRLEDRAAETWIARHL